MITKSTIESLSKHTYWQKILALIKEDSVKSCHCFCFYLHNLWFKTLLDPSCCFWSHCNSGTSSTDNVFINFITNYCHLSEQIMTNQLVFSPLLMSSNTTATLKNSYSFPSVTLWTSIHSETMSPSLTSSKFWFI